MLPVGVAAVALGEAELTESSVMLEELGLEVELSGGGITAAVELSRDVEAEVELS